MTEAPLPFKPGDWAVNASETVAKVKAVYREYGTNEMLLDLVIYDWSGDKVGRMSPACGGPRTFEPACDAGGWQRIGEPTFPIRSMWVDNGHGRKVAQMWAGERLPPANYIPKPKRTSRAAFADDRMRRALQEIADGHNDPRALAKRALGR